MRSFSEISWYDFQNQHYKKIKKEIEALDKEYILNVVAVEYISHLVAKYTIEPLEVIRTEEHFDAPRKNKQRRRDMFREEYMAEIMTFEISYPFIGDYQLFRIKPSSFTLTSHEILIDAHRKKVMFKIELDRADPNLFQQLKDKTFGAAFTNVANINADVKSLNNSIRKQAEDHFNMIKASYLKENDFFAAINVKKNPNTDSVFTPPVIKKISIPQPDMPTMKEFTAVPTIALGIYEDILKVVYDSGKNMEKKPSLYIGKDEEALREVFLHVLETRYEGITATGETFNREGKTDILLKYAADGSNVFVAECKFWHGSSEFHKAISQLFDRYLTWRDSKVALILFVNNQSFSTMLATILSETPKHPLFKKVAGKRGESSFSFVFHLPQDKDKDVLLEIMAFHYDKKK